MTTQEKINAIRKTDLFGQVSADALKQLAEKAVERCLRQEEILFIAGDPAHGLFVIVSGALRAFRQNPDGREQTIHVECEAQRWPRSRSSIRALIPLP